MKLFERLFPWLVLLVFVAYIGKEAMAPRDDDPMNLRQLAATPVLDGGRIKPLETFADLELMAISDRTWFIANSARASGKAGEKQAEAEGPKEPAIKWLLATMAGTDEARHYEVFRIESIDVLSAMGLPERARFRYSIADLTADGGAPINKLIENLQRIDNLIKNDNVDPKDLTPTQKAMRDLWMNLGTYREIMSGAAPLEVPKDLEAAMQPAAGQSVYNVPAQAGMESILSAYKSNNVSQFNSAVAAYHDEMISRTPDKGDRIGVEMFYNHLDPFVQCMGLYIAGFLLVAIGWLGWTKPLHRAALAVLIFAVVFHAASLVARMYLMDRPLVFVTNLYSSAIFIAFGAVLFGLVTEWFFRNGLAMAMASVVGFASLLVAHQLHLAETKDQLEMMQAVLDTNFWLATHVTTVTLGYTATFLAGFIGMVFVVAGVFTPIFDKEAVKTIGRMIYGVICFALLLSFVGTVLGGIWADQSWGRFWGWDPKENGALLIVLWNALILHGRWAGWFRERGVAVASIFGNIVVAWSWFGTNQLGAGLHAYGFSEKLATGLVWFAASQLVLIAIGLMPRRMWRCFSDIDGSAPPPLPKGKSQGPRVAPA